MNARDFVYWLQGFMEIQDPSDISEEKLDIIKNHLRLTFFHDLEAKISKESSNGLNPHIQPTPDVKIRC